MTAEGVCKQADSSLRVWKEDLLIHLFWPEEVSKGLAAPALRSGHLINAPMRSRDLSTSCLWPLRTGVSGGVVGRRCSASSSSRDAGMETSVGVASSFPFRLVETSAVTPLNSSTSGRFLKMSGWDETFSLRLINLMHPSSSPGGCGREDEWKRLIWLCVCVHLCECMCTIVTTGGDKFCTLQPLSLVVDPDLLELLCSAALVKAKSSRGFKDGWSQDGSPTSRSDGTKYELYVRELP